MSQIIDNYLTQKHADSQKQLQHEYQQRIESMLEFADKMDDKNIVHVSDVKEKLTNQWHTTDISGFHDIATKRNTHYIYDKVNELLALADETDLKKNRFYKIVTNIHTLLNSIIFLSLIMFMGAAIKRMIYSTEHLTQITIIITSIFAIDQILSFLASKYYQKYEIYGATGKRKEPFPHISKKRVSTVTRL